MGDVDGCQSIIHLICCWSTTTDDARAWETRDSLTNVAGDDDAHGEAVVGLEQLVVLLEGHQHVLGRVQRLVCVCREWEGS